MNNCPNCGAKLQENARFCDSCGSPVVQAYKQEVRQQNFVPEGFNRQQNTYANNPAYHEYQKPATKPKLNYILFMFVTSIIFFSYSALRLFITLVLPSTWVRTNSGFYNATVIIYVVIVLSTFAIMLAQLIVVINCFKNRNYSLENIKSPAAKLSGLCLASFLLGLALLISAILLFVGTGSALSGYYWGYDYLTLEEEAFVLVNLVFAITFFIYDIVFLVFASINLSKSGRFKKQVNEFYEKEQAEELE